MLEYYVFFLAEFTRFYFTFVCGLVTTTNLYIPLISGWVMQAQDEEDGLEMITLFISI